eukprot:1192858-Prorocentrum_minimum.AAC.1
MVGRACHDIMFFVPVEFGIAVGFSLFSYADHVNFALIADGHVPEPQRIVDHFLHELETLKNAVLASTTTMATEQPEYTE